MDNEKEKTKEDSDLLEAYKVFQKEKRRKRLLSDLGISEYDGVAKKGDVEVLKKDVSALLEILGYHRESVFGTTFNTYLGGPEGPRFKKNVPVKKVKKK